MAHDVFISYAVEDREVADEVCGALEGGGVKCWIAPRDIPFGADYEESIVDAIASSRLLVLVLSAHSNASPHVKREIQNASVEGSATQIIPLRIEDIEYNKALRYYLASAQWLDASTLPLEQHLGRLVEHVRTRLTGTSNVEQVERLTAGARPGVTRSKLFAAGAGLMLLALVFAAVLFVSPSMNTNNANMNTNKATPTPQTTASPQQTPSPTPQASPTPSPRPPIRNFNRPLNFNLRRPQTKGT